MLEQTLSTIVRELLQCEALGPDDDFFELGGSSLLAIELSRRVHEALGLELPLVDVFRHPTVRELAALLVGQTAAPAHVVPLAPAPSHPVSPLQHSLHVLEHMCSPADRAVVPVAFTLDATVDPTLAEAALRRVLDRHEILRTTFTVEGSRLVQRVHPSTSHSQGLAWTDLRQAAAAHHALQALLDAAVADPFDLERGPLVRLHLIQLAEARCVALLSIHHIISDGFSAAIFERDLRWAYDELAATTVLAAGLAPPPPLPFHYKDYVAWLDRWIDGPAGEQARAHWTRALQDRVPSRPFGDDTTSGSFATAMHEAPLDAATRAVVRRLSEQLDVTPFVVLQACVRVLLWRWTGCPGMVVGVAVATRDALPLSGQIGPYVNTLPVWADVPARGSFARLVAAVDQAMLAALAHALLPVEQIAAALTGGAPLFDVGMTMQPRSAAGQRLERPRSSRSDPLGIALLFIAYDDPDALDLRVRYRTGRFSHEQIVTLHDALSGVIHAVGERPDAPLEEALETRTPTGRLIELELE